MKINKRSILAVDSLLGMKLAEVGLILGIVGVLLMYFNWVLLNFTLWAIVMLHLQILQEEQYLPTVFGDKYLEYKKHTMRYLGRKR